MVTMLADRPPVIVDDPFRRDAMDETVAAVSSDADVSDLDLRFVGGGDDALRDAYDAHGSLVFSMARRTLSHAAASEVTQDVFVAAWRFRERFDPEKGTLAGWLVGITRNKVIDAIRSEQRHTKIAAAVDEGDGVHHDVVAIGDRMLLATALEQLPERVRTAVYLSSVEGLSHQDISLQTGHPLGTVKSDIRRGLARLRRHLESTEVAFG